MFICISHMKKLKKMYKLIIFVDNIYVLLENNRINKNIIVNYNRKLIFLKKNIHFRFANSGFH